MRWCEYNAATGQILSTGIGLPGMTEKDFPPTDGKRYFGIPEDITAATHYLVDGKFVLFPSKPDNSYQWDWENRVWKQSTELAAMIVVYTRNKLLIETDWTQLPDVPEVTRNLWVEYRQALRDITEQVGYPLNISWPTKPS